MTRTGNTTGNIRSPAAGQTARSDGWTRMVKRPDRPSPRLNPSDATTRTSQPRFSSVEGYKPAVKQEAPAKTEQPLHVPTWMIPLVVLGGAAIMAVGAAIAYWWMR